MSAVDFDGPEIGSALANGEYHVKRECDIDLAKVLRLLIVMLGRRRSTILNPKSYVKEELWKEAPVLTGSTKFEPLGNTKNILVTGGAGFMYVV